LKDKLQVNLVFKAGADEDHVFADIIFMKILKYCLVPQEAVYILVPAEYNGFFVGVCYFQIGISVQFKYRFRQECAIFVEGLVRVNCFVFVAVFYGVIDVQGIYPGPFQVNKVLLGAIQLNSGKVVLDEKFHGFYIDEIEVQAGDFHHVLRFNFRNQYLGINLVDSNGHQLLDFGNRRDLVPLPGQTTLGKSGSNERNQSAIFIVPFDFIEKVGSNFVFICNYFH
jgi:hypothetical protein